MACRRRKIRRKDVSRMHRKSLIRGLSAGLAFLLLLCTFPLSALAGEEAVAEDKLPQRIQRRFLYIENVDDLLQFARDCKTADYSENLRVCLKADLYLDECTASGEFEGITSFAGCFDGRHHTIYGLKQTEGSEALGLFHYIEEGATVCNLTVTGEISSSDSQNHIGGIAGMNSGTIRNCRFVGHVNGTGISGGVVGLNGEKGKVTGCESSGSVNGIHSVGGIAGYNRGIIVDCINGAEVNSGTDWMDLESDNDMSASLSGILGQVRESMEDSTDFGGVAGFSDGVIQRCENKGTVGYSHAGRNVGGIVGRQSGQVMGCRNSGSVYGKQDIGGIVGQFEPRKAFEDAGELDEMLSELHEEMNHLLDDMGAMGDTFHTDFQELNQSAKDASDTAKKMGDEMIDVIQGNVNVINELSDRVDFCMKHFGKASDSLNVALDYAEQMQKHLNQLMDDIEEALPDEEDRRWGEIEIPDNISNDLDRVSENAEKMNHALQEAGRELKCITDYLDSLQQLKAVNLSPEFDQNADRLKKQLDHISDVAGRLEDNTYDYSRILEEDLRDINDKTYEISTLLTYKVDNLEALLGGEDIIVDLSTPDCEEEEASGVSDCVNSGVINGDRNVGGIAGTVGVEATESDRTNKISIGNKYVARAILRGCKNEGFLTVKHENAGGIVGNLELGYLYDCQGAGRIQSDQGNHLGGIAGMSRGTIDSCSFSGVLRGKKCVGGIAGQGTKISNCYSMAGLLEGEGWIGAIAGQDLEEDAGQGDVTIARETMKERFTENYYVGDSLYGINGVSYKSCAEAISYEELMEREDVPELFANLNVTFLDEQEQVVCTRQLPYGSDLALLEYPDLGADHGDYMEWEGLIGEALECNLVLQAVETANVTTLASTETEAGKPLALVSGVFTRKALLHAEYYTGPLPGEAEGFEAYAYTVRGEYASLNGNSVTPIRLYRPGKGKVTVYGLRNGRWEKLPSHAIGSYEEVELIGEEGTFCLVYIKERNLLLTYAAFAAAVLLSVLLGGIFLHRKKLKKKAL